MHHNMVPPHYPRIGLNFPAENVSCVCEPAKLVTIDAAIRTIFDCNKVMTDFVTFSLVWIKKGAFIIGKCHMGFDTDHPPKKCPLLGDKIFLWWALTRHIA